jgi:hypothetical protein
MFIKNKTREVKTVIEIDKINEVLKKYIDFNKIFLKKTFQERPVKFLDHPNDVSLLLNFENSISEDEIIIYSIVKDRYIDFIMNKISEAEANYPDNSYLFKINQANVSAVTRASIRNIFISHFPSASRVKLSRVKETVNDLKSTILINVLIKDYFNRLKNYDFKKVFSKDDPSLPAEIKFVIKSNLTLFIKDTSTTDKFINDNSDFLIESGGEELKSELIARFKKFQKEYKSFLIRPIEYLTKTGDQFAIAYLMIASKDTNLDEDDILETDQLALDLSEKIKDGNTVEYSSKGKIINLSPDGACIEFDDAELFNEIVHQDSMIFNLNFRGEQPIRVSGAISYIYTFKEPLFRIGINFTGSKYGPLFKKIVSQKLEKIEGAQAI